MNTQKIVIGILVAIGFIALIVWIIKQLKRSNNNSTTPSDTDTGTGREQFQPRYQQVPYVNTGMRMGGGVPSGGGARVSGNVNH